MEDKLEKALPPKLAYRLRAWLKRFGGVTPRQKDQLKQDTTKAVIDAIGEQLAKKELKKSQIMASMYENGALRLDFGAAIPEGVKKAAMEWAKKKGLKAIEAGLNKSTQAPDYVLFGSGDTGSCIERIVFDLD